MMHFSRMHVMNHLFDALSQMLVMARLHFACSKPERSSFLGREKGRCDGCRGLEHRMVLSEAETVVAGVRKTQPPYAPRCFLFSLSARFSCSYVCFLLLVQSAHCAFAWLRLPPAGVGYCQSLNYLGGIVVIVRLPLPLSLSDGLGFNASHALLRQERAEKGHLTTCGFLNRKKFKTEAHTLSVGLPVSLTADHVCTSRSSSEKRSVSGCW